MVKLIDLLIDLTARSKNESFVDRGCWSEHLDPKLLLNARKTADLLQVMNKYEDHAEISGKCCTLLWLLAKNSISEWSAASKTMKLCSSSLANDLRGNQVTILRTLVNLLQKHPHDSALFTKVCMAFLPLIFQSKPLRTIPIHPSRWAQSLESLLDQLAQFNLVRSFTIGLQEHLADRQAIKAGSWRSPSSFASNARSRLALAVLSELFKLDGKRIWTKRNNPRVHLERCVMRFLCSRSTDGTLLDTMDILNRIFNRYPNDNAVARALVLLLTSMLPYGWCPSSKDPFTQCIPL